MPSKGRIVYVGPMSFPLGGAAARRILGNALSMISAGYEVIIGSGQLSLGSSGNFNEYEGIRVYSIGERTSEDKPVFLKHLAYTAMGKKTVKWLNTLHPKPAAVILYSGDFPYLIRLMPWCKTNRIPLIFEACEWFDPSNVPGGKYSLYRLNHELTMHFLVRRVKNVLAISTFLDEYYRDRGCETVCVPPTIDCHIYNPGDRSNISNLINLAYTGSPGKKDLFNNYLEALFKIDLKGEKFRFNIAGLSDDEILGYPAIVSRKITSLPAFINNIGYVSHEKAINLVGDSDFSILLRYPKRYAHAGFPTKVVESMVMGTPVICNLTSDLHKYVIDGVSGIVCNNFSVDSLVNALIRVGNLSYMEIREMSKTSRKIAETSFDYRSYITILDNFIQRLKLL